MNNIYKNISRIEDFFYTLLYGNVSNNIYPNNLPISIDKSWKEIVVIDAGAAIRDMDAYGVLANCSRCRKGMHRIAFDLFEKRVALKKEEVKVPRTTYVVNEYLTSSFNYIRRMFRISQINNQKSP